MRFVSRLAATLILLAACQMQAPKPGADDLAAPLAPEAITVTTLDGAPVAPEAQASAAADLPVVQTPDATTPRPAPRPAPTQTPVAAQPLPEVSPEQALCEKSGGEWSEMTGSTGHVCVHRLRDSGKFCRKKGDCQGECLAKSNTCAPIAPLMGCNDILQANGTEVTLCLQ